MASEKWASAINITSNYTGQKEQENFFFLSYHYERNYIYRCQSNNMTFSRVGGDGTPESEAIRFKVENNFSFSNDTVTEIIQDKDINQTKESLIKRYDFNVSFMGLLGCSGVLPQHYTKFSLERVRQGDTAFVDFVGLFEHRLISLYYCSWIKYRLSPQYEYSLMGGKDNFSEVIKSFTGVSSKNFLQTYYSGHYSRSNRSAENLSSLLKDMLACDVDIDSMVGRWLPINKKYRCTIGVSGANHRLGSGVVLGKRYWDIQSKININIKDIDMQDYLDLQQGNRKYDLLVSAINTYVPTHIDVCLIFNIRGFKQKIGKIGNADHGLQLSKNTWLMSKQKEKLFSKHLLLKRQ